MPQRVLSIEGEWLVAVVATWSGTGLWSVEFGENERMNLTWCLSEFIQYCSFIKQ